MRPSQLTQKSQLCTHAFICVFPSVCEHSHKYTQRMKTDKDQQTGNWIVAIRES